MLFKDWSCLFLLFDLHIEYNFSGENQKVLEFSLMKTASLRKNLFIALKISDIQLLCLLYIYIINVLIWMLTVWKLNMSWILDEKKKKKKKKKLPSCLDISLNKVTLGVFVISPDHLFRSWDIFVYYHICIIPCQDETILSVIK